MKIKGQDVLVLVKLLLLKGEPWTYARLAVELSLSVSELHASVKRLKAAKLVGAKRKVILPHAEEFLLHGVKYVFPAELGRPMRGTPTAYGVPPLAGQLSVAEDPPVWPDGEGDAYGVSLSPLFPKVIPAVKKDPKLHQMMALLDALRMGKRREVELSENALRKIIRECSS